MGNDQHPGLDVPVVPESRDKLFRHWGDSVLLSPGQGKEIARVVLERPTPMVLIADADQSLVFFTIQVGVYRTAMARQTVLSPAFPLSVIGETVYVSAVWRPAAVVPGVKAKVRIMIVPTVYVPDAPMGR